MISTCFKGKALKIFEDKSKLSFCDINSDLILKFNLKKKYPYCELDGICDAVYPIENGAVFKESMINYIHFKRDITTLIFLTLK